MNTFTFKKIYCGIVCCLLILSSLFAGGGSIALAQENDTYTITFSVIQNIAAITINPVQASYGEIVPKIEKDFPNLLYGFFSEKDANGYLYYSSQRSDVAKIILKENKIFDKKNDTTIYSFSSQSKDKKPIILNPNGGILGGTTTEDNIEWVEWNTLLKSGRQIPTRQGYKFLGFYDVLGEFNKDDGSYQVEGTEWYDENMVCNRDTDDINLDWVPRVVHAKWEKQDSKKQDSEKQDNNFIKILIICLAVVSAIGIILLIYFFVIKKRFSKF
ncbi:MAG: hypothetical protein FWF56_03785 [Firmicutes bacterium]|nr:hypothetical protein [Bacillota bacterium]